MNNLLLTIIGAVILMLLVVVALGIGWLLSGKNRLRKRCGMTPKKNGTRSSGTCSVCGSRKKCDENDDDDRPDANPKPKGDC